MSKKRSILKRFIIIFLTIVVLLTIYEYIVKKITSSSSYLPSFTEVPYEETVSNTEVITTAIETTSILDTTMETISSTEEIVPSTTTSCETVSSMNDTIPTVETTIENNDIEADSSVDNITDEYMANTESYYNISSKNQIGVVVEVSNTLNIRTEPTTNSEILTSIKNDSLVIVCETIHTDEINSTWYKILFKNTVGYVSAKYIDILEDIPLLDSKEDEFWTLTSTATTRASSSENRDHNIALACSIITEKVVPSGEVFSWFDTIGGSCSKDKGFKEATIFIKDSNGNTILGKGSGGGVCQVSTTIHIAVKGLGIDEDDIHAIEHSKRVSYASIDEEASVSYPYRDFYFKNTLDKPIILEMISYKGSCMCNIYVQN